jgi:hypothetical protein
MRTWLIKITAGIFLLAAATGASASGIVYKGDDLSIRHRGVIRNIFSTGSTLALYSPSQSYIYDIQRVRSDWMLTFRKALRFRTVYDHELRLGDYLETQEYLLGKNYKTPGLIDLDKYLVERSEADWRHRLYRLNVELDLYPVRLTAGRQQISWGTGYFWNPTDLFNPVAFTLVEMDERYGADALSLEVGIGDLSQVQAAWAPARDPHRSRGAARFKTNVQDYDFSVMAGWIFRDRVLGADFSGQVGGAGLRGEWLHNFAWEREDYDQLVLGADYRFSALLILTAEYLYNSGPLSGFDLEKLFTLGQTGSVATFSRHLGGVYADFQVHPLVHINAYLSADLEHGGVFFGPRFTWNVLTNLDLEAGAQLSSDRGEYKWLENSYYVTSSWYF